MTPPDENAAVSWLSTTSKGHFPHSVVDGLSNRLGLTALAARLAIRQANLIRGRAA